MSSHCRQEDRRPQSDEQETDDGARRPTGRLTAMVVVANGGNATGETRENRQSKYDHERRDSTIVSSTVSELVGARRRRRNDQPHDSDAEANKDDIEHTISTRQLPQ